MTTRIAMWSGPRNISTAMMRSWENRPDCSVVDEPFYACFLKQTGEQHPAREAILLSQSCDWQQVIRQLTQGQTENLVFYQKQMTHHIPQHLDMSWTKAIKNVFLIRDPRKVVASYARARPGIEVTQADIGIIRQYELYQELSRFSATPIPVVESADVLANPQLVLQKLCQTLTLPFDRQMLNWPAGERESDGVWAPHWYAQVEKSTGFSAPNNDLPQLTKEQNKLAQEAMPYYQKLFEIRLKV